MRGCELSLALPGLRQFPLAISKTVRPTGSPVSAQLTNYTSVRNEGLGLPSDQESLQHNAAF